MIPWRFILPLAGGAALACAFLAASAPSAPLVLFNVTSSLPEGAWRRSSRAPAVGEVVAVRAPPQASTYLAGLGYPAETPLLKRVIAMGEGLVCSSERFLAVGDWTIPRRSHDRRGAPIPAWAGCRTLAPDELVVLGASPDSFDSRYFGPVRATEILGVYEPMR
ncbi:S26 family signal peptidase [Phenylobacterium sp.]|jgi:type IV secretory pathway protease TraF|uniref:S26 family signal peptidase n=1 Tax=Phenylobacterium sp. TaxID=1871053 RepID=UPI002E32782C|nr:S26 family signal peptidase [Phenylobacterium sp.]HEX2559665.1 S26 family signal peptidase [Phenylobacterium sp.]